MRSAPAAGARAGRGASLTRRGRRSFFGDRAYLRTPKEWSADSYSVGMKHTYLLQPGGAVTDAYVQQAREVCKQQVALGGHRLALMIEAIVSERQAAGL